MTRIEDNKEPRKSMAAANVHVFDGSDEYILAFLGETSARLFPCSGGPKITVPRAEIAEYLDAPREGKCDCCGRMTRHIVVDRETGLRVFRDNRCDHANQDVL